MYSSPFATVKKTEKSFFPVQDGKWAGAQAEADLTIWIFRIDKSVDGTSLNVSFKNEDVIAVTTLSKNSFTEH